LLLLAADVQAANMKYDRADQSVAQEAKQIDFYNIDFWDWKQRAWVSNRTLSSIYCSVARSHQMAKVVATVTVNSKVADNLLSSKPQWGVVLFNLIAPTLHSLL